MIGEGIWSGSVGAAAMRVRAELKLGQFKRKTLFQPFLAP
jgi:hypothetical protein